jgi:branched-chain amino acid transport system substrate-binding protein
VTLRIKPSSALSALIRTLLAIIIALSSLGAISERVRQEGVTDDEIRIGNVMPYSGNLAVFGEIGKAEAAYFELLNQRGGINGRKVRFISHDDKSDPASVLRLTRTLVEDDKVLLMFGSFGTPGNFAVRNYLNERQIPQLFVASGDDHLSDPTLYPWTMGWQPSFREEGRIYANSPRSGRTIILVGKLSKAWRTVSVPLRE